MIDIKKFESCSHCKKKMNTTVQHLCYGSGSFEVHNICEEIVCHECWDKFLREAVEDAEAQFLQGVLLLDVKVPVIKLGVKHRYLSGQHIIYTINRQV